MFTYNITFVVAPHQEKALVDYLLLQLTPKLLDSKTLSISPQLKKVVEVGGDKPGPDHASSIAMSAEFDSEEKAHHWNDYVLLPALRDFNMKFGPDSIFFITLLENIQ